MFCIEGEISDVFSSSNCIGSIRIVDATMSTTPGPFWAFDCLLLLLRIRLCLLWVLSEFTQDLALCKKCLSESRNKIVRYSFAINHLTLY